jgi:hypothetical protein
LGEDAVPVMAYVFFGFGSGHVWLSHSGNSNMARKKTDQGLKWQFCLLCCDAGGREVIGNRFFSKQTEKKKAQPISLFEQQNTPVIASVRSPPRKIDDHANAITLPPLIIPNNKYKITYRKSR